MREDHHREESPGEDGREGPYIDGDAVVVQEQKRDHAVIETIPSASVVIATAPSRSVSLEVASSLRTRQSYCLDARSARSSSRSMTMTSLPLGREFDGRCPDVARTHDDQIS